MRTQLSNSSNIVQAVQPQQLDNDTTKYLLKRCKIKFREQNQTDPIQTKHVPSAAAIEIEKEKEMANATN